ncbi:MAG TPA: AAA family ATPase, partial [Dongiaceae bacterium]
DRAAMGSACEEVMLNLLLNEMDGLREDADIFFILTTNRPETLEAALAARPGRIDQAIEFPLPDDECRQKLLCLYAGGLRFSDALSAEIVRRTAGVSAAFIKELVRRIAQASLDMGANGAATAQHVDIALDEMLLAGGALNTRILGGRSS